MQAEEDWSYDRKRKTSRVFVLKSPVARPMLVMATETSAGDKPPAKRKQDSECKRSRKRGKKNDREKGYFAVSRNRLPARIGKTRNWTGWLPEENTTKKIAT